MISITNTQLLQSNCSVLHFFQVPIASCWVCIILFVKDVKVDDTTLQIINIPLTKHLFTKYRFD